MNGTSESLIQKQLLDLFLFFGSEWVLHLLLILSVVSVAITLERIHHFWTYCRSSKDLPMQINAHLTKNNIEGARSLLKDDPSHVAFVGLQGLEGFHRGSAAVEELMLTLAGKFTIVIVTHNMAQARRVSDECIFMLLGEIIEHDRTEQLFLAPKNPKTSDYIEGRYG